MLRCWPLLGCLLFFTVISQADSITIGQLQYIGTENGVSAFKVTINTNGITQTPLSFASAALLIKSASQIAGPITSPSVILFTGGPGRSLPACPCSSVLLQLTFPSADQKISFTLAGGTLFTTHSTVTFNLHTLDGGRLHPGDVIPISLTSVPELGTLTLVGSGLVFAGTQLARRVREKRKLRASFG